MTAWSIRLARREDADTLPAIERSGAELLRGHPGVEGIDPDEVMTAAQYRALIAKGHSLVAIAEGGVVVTNLDVDQYAHEMDKLRAMTRAELLAMIADEKRGHGGVEKSGDGESDVALRGKGGGAAPASGDGSMPTSGSGDGSGGSSPTRMFDGAPRSGWPSGDEHAGGGDDRAGRFEGKKETTPEGSSGDERATSEKATSGKRGTKRSAAPPMPPPSPRVPGKQRRTKQAPRQAPCAA